MEQREKLKSFLRDEIKKFCFKTVTDTDSLVQSGLLDSITMVDLAVSIEETYGIVIPQNQVARERFETVETITDLLVELGVNAG